MLSIDTDGNIILINNNYKHFLTDKKRDIFDI